MPVELTSIRRRSRMWRRDESEALDAAIDEKRDLANNRTSAYNVWTREECERLTAAGLLD